MPVVRVDVNWAIESLTQSTPSRKPIVPGKSWDGYPQPSGVVRPNGAALYRAKGVVTRPPFIDPAPLLDALATPTYHGMDTRDPQELLHGPCRVPALKGCDRAS
jgi:hypothetical protein